MIRITRHVQGEALRIDKSGRDAVVMDLAIALSLTDVLQVGVPVRLSQPAHAVLAQALSNYIRDLEDSLLLHRAEVPFAGDRPMPDRPMPDKEPEPTPRPAGVPMEP